MEQEAREKEKKRQSESTNNLLTGEPIVAHDPSNKSYILLNRACKLNFIFTECFLIVGAGFATLDTTHAICLPLGASISLLVMFFFFDSMQMLFAACTAIIATIALAFLLLPMCQYIIRPCNDGNRISLGCCGRYTAAELLSFTMSITVVCIWVLTGHWLLMDAMGIALCVAFIAFVRLPSLKVSTLLLIGLLIYDVFWVFFSSYIFR